MKSLSLLDRLARRYIVATPRVAATAIADAVFQLLTNTEVEAIGAGTVSRETFSAVTALISDSIRRASVGGAIVACDYDDARRELAGYCEAFVRRNGRREVA